MREQKFRYTYRRKEDGHIYQIIASLQYLEQLENNEIHSMKDNDLWELITRDEFSGITDKKDHDIYENDIYQREGYAHMECGCPTCNPKPDVVRFVDGCFFIDDDLVWKHRHTGEVIGDIHQNSELLEEST